MIKKWKELKKEQWFIDLQNPQCEKPFHKYYIVDHEGYLIAEGLNERNAIKIIKAFNTGKIE